MNQDSTLTQKDSLIQVALESNTQKHDQGSWRRNKSNETIILQSPLNASIRKGYHPIDTVSGDINNDRVPDL